MLRNKIQVILTNIMEFKIFKVFLIQTIHKIGIFPKRGSERPRIFVSTYLTSKILNFAEVVTIK